MPATTLGLVLSESGQLDEAIAQYRKAVGINPNFAIGRYNLGNALSQNGDLDAAIVQYQKAIEIKPTYAEWTTRQCNHRVPGGLTIEPRSRTRPRRPGKGARKVRYIARRIGHAVRG